MLSYFPCTTAWAVTVLTGGAAPLFQVLVLHTLALPRIPGTNKWMPWEQQAKVSLLGTTKPSLCVCVLPQGEDKLGGTLGRELFMPKHQAQAKGWGG